MEENIILMVQSVLEQLKQLKYANNTIKQYEHSVFAPVLREYSNKNQERYDPEIIDYLWNLYDSQYKKGEITRSIYNLRKRGLLILQEIHNNGISSLKPFYTHVAHTIPSSYYNIFNRFTSSLTSLSDNTKRKIEIVVVRFLNYLDSIEVNTIADIAPCHLEAYFRFEHSENRGLETNIYALRKFFSFLGNSGIDVHKLWIFLKASIPFTKVKMTFSSEEVNRLLDAVDNSQTSGKRDLAILALAVTTGLRAIDIVTLKLKDILWRDKELRITQKKTGKALSLPLDSKVMKILSDYILNGRPSVTYQEVFITSYAPHKPLSSGSVLSGVIEKYMKIAGIDHNYDDGKTFHGLRRYVGTQILSTGIPVTTAAQVLGHSSISSTKQYISVDIKGLRKCILPMNTLGGHR